MESFQLTEYRCKCGKLLFKGLVVLGVVEIKCRRCGSLLRKEHVESGMHIHITCNDDLEVQSASRQLHVLHGSDIVGKQLNAVFPVLHDKSDHVKALREKRNTYMIPDNTLLLKDGATIPAKSHFMRNVHMHQPGYSVFTWIPEQVA